jgi:hypothetical protein
MPRPQTGAGRRDGLPDLRRPASRGGRRCYLLSLCCLLPQVTGRLHGQQTSRPGNSRPNFRWQFLRSCLACSVAMWGWTSRVSGTAEFFDHYGVFLEALSTVRTANVADLGTHRFSGVPQAFKLVTAHGS